MKTKALLPFIFLTIMTILTGCDYYDDRLEIENATNSDIVVETFLDSVPSVSEANSTEYYLNNRIPPSETTRLVQMGSTNGWYFRIKRSKNNRLNLFVFESDSLKKHGLDYLIKNRIYNSYTLTESELEDKNWKIVIK